MATLDNKSTSLKVAVAIVGLKVIRFMMLIGAAICFVLCVVNFGRNGFDFWASVLMLLGCLAVSAGAHHALRIGKYAK